MPETKTRRANGEGTFFERPNGRVQGRLRLPDGSRRSFTGRNKTEVSRKLAEARQAVKQGLTLPKERLTVGVYLTSWLAGKRAKPKTLAGYSDAIRLHLLPGLGTIPLARLDWKQVEAFYKAKEEAGLSSTSVHHLHGVLRQALKKAQRVGLVAQNVTDLVEAPRIRPREMQPLDRDQARAFLEAATGDRFEALYELALSTGMRQGELLALHWNEVDLEAGRLTVRYTLASIRGRLTITEPKTRSARRQILLTPRVVAVLRAHRTFQKEELLRRGVAWDKDTLLFSTWQGKPFQATHLLRGSFFPLLKSAGLPHIHFHDLRHTAATLLLLSPKVNVKAISEMLGHANVRTTLSIYAHVLPTMQENIVEAMGALLGAKGESRYA
ncbi:MAG TPA: tyrosine-type recombinase/integrase [Ktedonobacterales bacterium]|jgi:integrase